ncbi:MAG: Ca(2+)/H(+) antiporter [Bryobacteraceae bacterium]|nr:Ca(2+)/H(+) antiporter [Bryobacteraceae bacterium]
MNFLLLFVPVCVYLEFARPDWHIAIFLCACLAIIPLAGWLGRATEHLASRTSEAIGGLLNATFGNAAELIIALVALQKGLHGVVKASLTGSIIGNVLLVLGAACFAGGYRHKILRFNATGARSQASMMTLAAIALIMPASFHYLGGAAAPSKEAGLSLEIAIVLVATYFASLLFSLHTHRQLFESLGEEQNHGHAWSLAKSLSILFVSTAFIAWMSEILVGSVEHAAHSLGMTSVFVGVIVVAIVGNAAEHSTAILMAMKNRMDLSLGIAMGSSVQIALFVAPVLVLSSYLIGPHPMDLVFTPAEVVAVVLAVAITAQISGDGESHWLEGVQLLAVYIILGIVFYFLPEAAGHPSN